MGLILVTGAGGFLGGHLIRNLLERGLAIRAVDCKPLETGFSARQMWKTWCMTSRKGRLLSRYERCRRGTILPPTWEEWGSSKTISPPACCRY